MSMQTGYTRFMPEPSSPHVVRLVALVNADPRTRRAIAQAAGMSEQQLWQVLSGHRADPSIGTIWRVLRALGKGWGDMHSKSVELVSYWTKTRIARTFSREDFPDAAINAKVPRLEPGTHDIPGHPHYHYMVESGNASTVRVLRNCFCICVIGIARTEGESKPLCEILINLTSSSAAVIDPVNRSAPSSYPPPAPWCAIVDLGLKPDEESWISDFGVHLAWKWSDQI